MPKMTGIELARAIRNSQQTSEVKILLNTGEDITRMSGADVEMFDGIIQKPINLEKLKDFLKKLDLVL